MRIEHVAMWVRDLEVMKDFYLKYFEVTSGKKYVNEHKKFASYFLSFEDGARLELMFSPDIAERASSQEFASGLTHLAISVGSKQKVSDLTERLRGEGLEIVGEPRTTGDGYYESVILDPEGNTIEITI